MTQCLGVQVSKLQLYYTQKIPFEYLNNRNLLMSKMVTLDSFQLIWFQLFQYSYVKNSVKRQLCAYFKGWLHVLCTSVELHYTWSLWAVFNSSNISCHFNIYMRISLSKGGFPIQTPYLLCGSHQFSLFLATWRLFISRAELC